ncbi:MAG: putative repeat protein (TIGR01451 family) [Flavobacteriaceae bacterium]|jgi:uncharacterized repeat protein (TIGR01451 family)|uniref:hypothetical protein n=1 Tax=Candidatus Marifrigoribacter sp. Uisw_064 TaxID=3230970 RepID=UPI003AED51B3
MKNIFKITLISFLFIGITSCEEGDLPIDNLYNNVVTSGSVLRILDFPADLVTIAGGEITPNFIRYQMEVQEGDGSSSPDFKEVRMYFDGFDDQDLEFPTLDGNGNIIGEQLYRTISKAEFTEISEINGLPEITVEVATRFLLDEFFGNAVFGKNPSFIKTRFELEMNDGRIWSDYNAGTTLGGPYFESPFTHRTIFKIEEGLETKMKVDEDEPTVGEIVKFTVEVKNLDLVNDNNDITMLISLPEGLTYDSDDGEGAYDPATQIYTVGTLVADNDDIGDDEEYKVKLKLYATVNAGTENDTIIPLFQEARGSLRNPAVDQDKLFETMVVQD